MILFPPESGFGRFVGTDDRITTRHDGFCLTATIHDDDDGATPWERDCGHGSVSKWTTRDKRPGERILNQDGHSYRFYDFAKAVKTALQDGWGCAGDDKARTKRQRAAMAAEADFKALRAWCNDDWRYVGVAVTVRRHGLDLVDKYECAFWGIEANYPGSDNSYLTETANELAEDALTQARAKLAELARYRPARGAARLRLDVTRGRAALARLLAARPILSGGFC